VSTNELSITSGDEVYIKDFGGWHDIKQLTHHSTRRFRFKEREIWSCRVGVNVGDEMDGKNKYFCRPVLIVRKFNKNLFWGIAMSSKVKDNPYYFPLEFKGRKGSVLLSHMRLYDAKRLHHFEGTLPEDKFNPIKTALIEVFKGE
jgi:mRNA interferase MazF